MGCVGSTPEGSDGPVKHGEHLSPDTSPHKPSQKPTPPAEAQPQQASISHSLSPAPPQHANSGDMLRLSGALPLESNPGGLTRQDSPETMRVTQRALNKPVHDDGIVTVWETDDDPASPAAAAAGHRSSRPRPGAGAWTNGHADHDGHLPGSCDESGADSGGSGASQGLPRQDSTKSRSAAILTIPVVGVHGARAASLEESLLLLDPSGHGAPLEDSLHPWKNSPPPKPRYPPPNEMVLDLSDDDDGDEQGAGPGFNMQRWKRHYTWNKTKHKDLLRFLWKRFDKAGWTVYCITWKQQDALLDAYQGENVIHGLSCRLDHLMSNAQPMAPVIPGGPTGSLSDQLFGVLLTLIEKGGDCHKVVGVLLAQGTAASPLCLHGLHELNSDWVVKPADVSDPLVRTFVSNLITCQPPLPQFEVAAMREIL